MTSHGCVHCLLQFISKSNNAQLVALETSLALIAIAYGVVLLLRYTKGAARMHYATKADAMVEYTKRLVNGRRIHGGPTANHRSSTSGGESGVELAPVGKSAAAKQRSAKAAAVSNCAHGSLETLHDARTSLRKAASPLPLAASSSASAPSLSCQHVCEGRRGGGGVG